MAVGTNRNLYKRRWYSVSAAAGLLVVIAAIWLIMQNRPTVPASVAANKPVILSPGGNRAILELSDGSTIDLAAAAKGTVLAKQGSAQAIKQDSGQLSYVHLKDASSAVAYNTVFTPRGGSYQVILPDHTIVWLNAESSIRFPTSFVGLQREVEITGEAYFEVAPNKATPFIVKAGDMNIKVLGTHFDIQMYREEKAKQVTLLEGSIALQAAGKVTLLHPGEQASVANGLSVGNVDTEEVVAWRDGFFMFDHADIESVMRQVSRWYNVNVVYEGQRTGKRLTGRVSRQSDAEDLTAILEANGYHLSMAADGKTIIILP